MQNITHGAQLSQHSPEPACSFLSALQWQNRVLVIPLNTASPSADLIAQLEQNKSSIEERRLKVLFITQSKLIDNTGDDYKIEAAKTCSSVITRDSDSRVFLVGLDGGLKSVYERYEPTIGIDLKAVFADIDGMPMRRSEMANGTNR